MAETNSGSGSGGSGSASVPTVDASLPGYSNGAGSPAAAPSKPDITKGPTTAAGASTAAAAVDPAKAAADQAAADAAAAADKVARTGKDGVVYDTAQQKAAADKVYDDQTAIGAIKPKDVTKKSDADILLQAQGLSQTAQAGAVSSATEAAKSSGLSPAQSALLGSKAGATTYQDTLGQNVNSQGQLAQEQYSTEQNAATVQYSTQLQSALQKYTADVAAKTGLQGQDLQRYISDQGNAVALQMQKAGLDAEKVKQQMDGLGFVLQAGSWILKSLVGLAKGTEHATEGDHPVGEKGSEIVISPDDSRAEIVGAHGPEVRHIEEGAKVIPHDVHDGYAMLEMIYGDAMPRLAKSMVGEFKLPDKAEGKLSDLRSQLESTLAYIKGAK